VTINVTGASGGEVLKDTDISVLFMTIPQWIAILEPKLEFVNLPETP
jgi:hypothetical protein